MNNRILIHTAASTDCISFRTMSRLQKSPHWFYILRSSLAELEHKTEITVHDINSFAVLHRDINTGTIEIGFTWLSCNVNSVSGYKETVILPYGQLAVFLHDSATESGPAIWKTLSADNAKRPKIVFKSKKNLHDVLANKILRHKLACYLRDGFNWPCSEKIELYDSFTPYSFVFKETRNGKPAINGGLILHGQGNMQKAYYSIHT